MNQTVHAPILDARLYTAFDFVRSNAVVADVGTDHAYLPAALVLQGRVSHAFAADINAGPLAKAAETVDKYQIREHIDLCLTDGLHGLEGKGITDILIFGMGGELIAKILSEAPFVRDSSIRLILQPMTKQAELRQWLAEEGFSIADERLSTAAGKIYQTICTEWHGKRVLMTPLELELGPRILEQKPPELRPLVSHKIEVLRARITGQRCVGEANEEDQKMLSAMESLLNELTERR